MENSKLIMDKEYEILLLLEYYRLLSLNKLLNVQCSTVEKTITNYLILRKKIFVLQVNEINGT